MICVCVWDLSHSPGDDDHIGHGDNDSYHAGHQHGHIKLEKTLILGSMLTGAAVLNDCIDIDDNKRAE